MPSSDGGSSVVVWTDAFSSTDRDIAGAVQLAEPEARSARRSSSVPVVSASSPAVPWSDRRAAPVDRAGPEVSHQHRHQHRGLAASSTPMAMWLDEVISSRGWGRSGSDRLRRGLGPGRELRRFLHAWKRINPLNPDIFAKRFNSSDQLPQRGECGDHVQEPRPHSVWR